MSYDEFSIPDASDAASIVTDYLARDPDTAVASAALAVFGVAVRVVLGYAPAYLRALGGGPVVIGLFASAALLIAAGYPRLDLGVAGRIGAHYRSAVLVALATLGLVVWLLAPGSAVGTRAATWLWMLVGLALLGAWTLVGDDAGLAGTGSILAFDRAPTKPPNDASDRDTPASGVPHPGTPVGFVVVALFLGVVPTFLAGFQVVVAILVAVGLCVTVFVAADASTDVGPSDSADRSGDAAGSGDSDGSADARGSDGSGIGGDGTLPIDPERTVEELRSLPAGLRRLLVGETLVRCGAGMVAAFVVIAVTTVVGVDATVLGLRLRPAAVFGVAVAVELTVSLAAAASARRIETRVGRGPLAAAGLLVAALFPIGVVSVPASPLAVGAVFAASGFRAVGRPARRSLLADHLGDRTDGPDPRFAREAAVAASPLVGGVLYAVNPTLAFGLATSVGLLGVREFLWFLREPSARGDTV